MQRLSDLGRKFRPASTSSLPSLNAKERADSKSSSTAAKSPAQSTSPAPPAGTRRVYSLRLSNLSTGMLMAPGKRPAAEPEPAPEQAEPAWLDKLKNLDAVLNDAQARAALEHFAASTYAAEGLHCLRSIDLFEHRDFDALERHLADVNAPTPSYFAALPADAPLDANQRRELDMARLIFETFFLPDAVQWCVNGLLCFLDIGHAFCCNANASD